MHPDPHPGVQFNYRSNRSGSGSSTLAAAALDHAVDVPAFADILQAFCPSKHTSCYLHYHFCNCCLLFLMQQLLLSGSLAIAGVPAVATVPAVAGIFLLLAFLLILTFLQLLSFLLLTCCRLLSVGSGLDYLAPLICPCRSCNLCCSK
jgi:hypothetical protein